MPEPFQVNAGRWWRHDRYEIRERHIRPADNARLVAYDPWEARLGSRIGQKEASPPYESLSGLIDDIEFHSKGRFAPESELMVVEWCARYGLLGVLLQRVRWVVLAPRWTLPAELSDPENRPIPSDRALNLVPVVRRFSRSSLGWVSTYSPNFAKGELLGVPDGPGRRGALVSKENHPDEWANTGVLVESMTDLAVDFEPLGKTWARYFPDVPREETESYEYPLPTTKEFWAKYAEPVDAFIGGARALRTALKNLQTTRVGFSRKEAQHVSLGMARLNALAAPASLALYPRDDGSLQQRWVSPSLLASYAMMIMQDCTENRRVIPCDNCKKLFVSDSYQSKYCSIQCRNTFQKRRYRQKKKRTE